MKNTPFMYLLVCKGLLQLRTMTSGWQGAPYYRRYLREFKTADFVEEKLMGTDSTIAPPPEPAVFFNERFMAARHKDTIENTVSMYFLVCKGLSIDDAGVSRNTVFQEIRPGTGFETSQFVEEKLGGAGAERLWGCRRTTHLHDLDHFGRVESVWCASCARESVRYRSRPIYHKGRYKSSLQ